MMRVASTIDGLPDRSSLTAQMLDWCMSEWGDTQLTAPASPHRNATLNRVFGGFWRL